MLKDIPPDKYEKGRVRLMIEQLIAESNQRLSTNCNGITTAPTRQSEMLRQIIRRLEVFFIDCFVAKKETIKTILIVMTTGQEIA